MNIKILKYLFNTTNINTLSNSDKLLYSDILKRLKSNKLRIYNGGGSQVGFSIRPDMGELNGMSLYSGYEVSSSPIYVDKLLDFIVRDIQKI
jgi:hypothetical protein